MTTYLAAETAELDTLTRHPMLDPSRERTDELIEILAASEHAEALAEWLADAPPAEDMLWYPHLLPYLATEARKRLESSPQVQF